MLECHYPTEPINTLFRAFSLFYFLFGVNFICLCDAGIQVRRSKRLLYKSGSGILPKALEESGVPVEYDVLKIAKP